MIRLGDDAVLLTGEEVAHICQALKTSTLKETRKHHELGILGTLHELRGLDKRIRLGGPCPHCGQDADT